MLLDWFYSTYGILFLSIVFILIICDHVFPFRIDLAGRHVLITGGSRGLGFAIAKVCFSIGSNLTLVARDETQLEKAREELLQYRQNETQWIDLVCLDVMSEFDLIYDTINVIRERRGPIEVLINNVGGAMPGRFKEQNPDVADYMMRYNYYSAVNVTKSVLPDHPARIVFVSSFIGIAGFYGYCYYSAAKFALRGFAESLQMELQGSPGDTKITIVIPPDLDTPGFNNENHSKPVETIEISGSNVIDPDVMASRTVQDLRAGKFLCTKSVDAWALAITCVGMTPHYTILQTIAEICLAGIVRVIALFANVQINGVVKKFAAERSEEVTSLITENGKLTTVQEEEEPRKEK